MSPSIKVTHVTSLDLPALVPYRTLRRHEEHKKQGIIVVESERVVRRLLGSRLSVVSLLIAPRWEEPMSNKILQRGEDIPLFVAPQRVLEEIVGYNFHEGIMAVARVPADATLEQLPAPHLLVALDGLTQAENVGVVVRNCAAFGVDLLIAGERAASPYLRRAVRNSMGTIFELNVNHTGDLHSTLRELRRRFGTVIVAADAHSSKTLGEASLGGNLCLVLGSEESGVSEVIAKEADKRVTIAMAEGVDSLNVASASSVFLYEARRQRHA